MSSRTIIDKLLNTLSKSVWGMTIEELSKATKLHRNTISKYLQRLEELGLVVKKTIGKYSIWLPKNIYNYYRTDTVKTFLELVISEFSKMEDGDGESLIKLGEKIAKGLMDRNKAIESEFRLNEKPADSVKDLLDVYIPTLVPDLKVKIRRFEFTDKMIVVSLTGCPCESINIKKTCKFFEGFVRGVLIKLGIEFKSIEIIDCNKDETGICSYAIILEKPIGEQLETVAKKWKNKKL